MGAAVHPHLMANDIYLVHLEHPLRRTPEHDSPAARHQALRWILSERRAHQSFLQRASTQHRLACDVIAPAPIPAGRRIKTDRRDAGHVAILFSAGALTPIHIPTEPEEAARDLLRCREDIRVGLLRAAIDSRSSCSVMDAASPPPRRRGRNDLMRGSGPRPGRCPRSTRTSARICARSTTRSPACSYREGPARTPRSGAPAAARPAAPLPPWYRRSGGTHDCRRARRPTPLCDGAAAHDSGWAVYAAPCMSTARLLDIGIGLGVVAAFTTFAPRTVAAQAPRQSPAVAAPRFIGTWALVKYESRRQITAKAGVTTPSG